MHVRRRGSPTAPSALVHHAWPRSGAERLLRAGASWSQRLPRARRSIGEAKSGEIV
jgi:hypothetical protein